jgi:hypothetical protein
MGEFLDVAAVRAAPAPLARALTGYLADHGVAATLAPALGLWRGLSRDCFALLHHVLNAHGAPPIPMAAAGEHVAPANHLAGGASKLSANRAAVCGVGSAVGTPGVSGPCPPAASPTRRTRRRPAAPDP